MEQEILRDEANVTVENLIIEEGKVASWDGNSLISTLGDLGGCKANASHCVMADGVGVVG
uniref:Uncharacterized protein n=1 Tax=Romanomermis culicivorax TaxID=13658 RepID=A0A915KJM3_ROMCU